MAFRRTGHACTKLGYEIIIAGGIDETGNTIDATEIVNVFTLEKRTVGALKIPRSYFGLAAFSTEGLNEIILAFGGYDSNKNSGNEFLSSVEQWNTENQTWQIIQDVSMDVRRSAFGFYEVSVDTLCGMCL